MIEWSKAPKGATHYSKRKAHLYKWHKKDEQGIWSYYNEPYSIWTCYPVQSVAHPETLVDKPYIPEKLEKFLLENKALDEFIENLEVDLVTITPSNYISAAFVWDCTESGDEYWIDLDRKWERHPIGHEDPSEEGIKYDSDKPRMDLLINGMPRALLEVGKVLSYGSEKYEDHNWLKVEEGENRYLAASIRHELGRAIDGDLDEESGLYHLAHKICCDLFRLEKLLREEK